MSDRQQQQNTTTIYRHQYEPSVTTAARNPLISTSNENESSLVEKVESSNGTVRRKLERFRSKLVELFFSSSSASSAPIQTPTPSPPLTPHTASSTSSSMSTYYFGYTTQSTFSTAVGNSSASRRLMLNSNYDATSTASSLASDDSNSSSSSATASDRQLDSASANCIPMREANPFLDPQLTSRLIHLNTPDLDLLKSQFEPFLCTIDDEDNFFDAEFMSAYIAYTLVTRLREQHELRQDESSIMGGGGSSNLAHEIAREIFAQSESEPCGLKGCRINVFLESASEEDEDDEMSTHPPTRTFLDRFRFDSTCLLTTFELNLVLKQVPNTRAIDLNNNSTTARRLSTNSTNRKNSSSKSVKFLRSSTSQTPVSNVSNNNNANNLIYLDESHFHLYKCSLY